MSIRCEHAYRVHIASAIVDESIDAHPPGLDSRAAQRFRVYRNNVHGALIGALSDAYPVVRSLVGEEFFAAMAREFFLSETVRGPSLALYGAGFADFIERFEPAASVVYLADVARLERARLESLHAADAEVLDPSVLPGDGDQLVHARFTPHPASRLIASAHPVVSIWLSHQPDAATTNITAASEHVLVTRPGFEVRTLRLDEPAGAFTHALMQGATVQTAYSSASAEPEEFDVVAVFSSLLEAGVFKHAFIQKGDWQ